MAPLVSFIAVAVAPALTQIAAELGGGGDGVLVAQLVMTVPSIFIIVGAAMSGYIAERIGRRALALICLLAYSLSGVAGFFVEGLEALVASRIVLGFAGGMMLTTGYATVGEYFEGSRREWMLGCVSACGSFSSVVLLWFGGDFVERFGWHAPFAVYALGMAVLPFAWFGMHRGLPPKSTGEVSSWRPIVRLWPLYLLVTVYTIGMYMPTIQAPFLLAERGETGPALVGKIISVSSLVAAIGALLYGPMRRWLNFNATFVCISAVLGIGMLMVVASGTPTMFVVACAVMGLGLGIIEPAIASEALGRTPEILHDRAVGISLAALFFGQFLNPLVAKPLRDAGGAGFTFTVIGSAFLLAAALFLIAALRPRQAQPAP